MAPSPKLSPSFGETSVAPILDSTAEISGVSVCQQLEESPVSREKLSEKEEVEQFAGDV